MALVDGLAAAVMRRGGRIFENSKYWFTGELGGCPKGFPDRDVCGASTQAASCFACLPL